VHEVKGVEEEERCVRVVRVDDVERVLREELLLVAGAGQMMGRASDAA